jgi:hypothetical protein
VIGSHHGHRVAGRVDRLAQVRHAAGVVVPFAEDQRVVGRDPCSARVVGGHLRDREAAGLDRLVEVGLVAVDCEPGLQRGAEAGQTRRPAGPWSTFLSINYLSRP